MKCSPGLLTVNLKLYIYIYFLPKKIHIYFNYQFFCSEIMENLSFLTIIFSPRTYLIFVYEFVSSLLQGVRILVKIMVTRVMCTHEGSMVQ